MQLFSNRNRSFSSYKSKMMQTAKPSTSVQIFIKNLVKREIDELELKLKDSEN